MVGSGKTEANIFTCAMATVELGGLISNRLQSNNISSGQSRGALRDIYEHALLEFGRIMPGTILAVASPPLTCSIASSTKDLCGIAGLHRLLCWRLCTRTAAARCGRRLRRCRRRRRRRRRHACCKRRLLRRACPAFLEVGLHLPHGTHACRKHGAMHRAGLPAGMATPAARCACIECVERTPGWACMSPPHPATEERG